MTKKVSNTPLIFDLIEVPGLKEQFEHLACEFKRIQQSLMSYLDNQRDPFPRLYFINNEDLLSVIYNRTNIRHINAHIHKLFPGVARLILFREDNSIITGIASCDDEEVTICIFIFKNKEDV